MGRKREKMLALAVSFVLMMTGFGISQTQTEATEEYAATYESVEEVISQMASNFHDTYGENYDFWLNDDGRLHVTYDVSNGAWNTVQISMEEYYGIRDAVNRADEIESEIKSHVFIEDHTGGLFDVNVNVQTFPDDIDRSVWVQQGVVAGKDAVGICITFSNIKQPETTGGVGYFVIHIGSDETTIPVTVEPSSEGYGSGSGLLVKNEYYSDMTLLKTPVYLSEKGSTQFYKGYVFQYNGRAYFQKEEAEQILAEMSITNAASDFYTVDAEIRQQINSNTLEYMDRYYIQLNGTASGVTLGKSGSFTIRYKDYEETFNVSVVDYATVPNKLVLFTPMGNSQYDFHSENGDTIYMDGTIYMDYDVSPYSGEAMELDFETCENGVYLSESGALDGSLFYITDVENAVVKTYTDKSSVPEQSMYLDEGNVAFVALLANNKNDGRPYLYINGYYEGEAWFTLHYGDQYSWRVHIVVDNPDGYACDAALSASKTEVETGETVDLTAEILPSDGYCEYVHWCVYADGVYSSGAESEELLSISMKVNDYSRGTDRKAVIRHLSDTTAQVTFYQPGTYKVVLWFGSSSTYLGRDFESHPLYFTVTGESMESPEYLELDSSPYAQFGGKDMYDDSLLHLLAYDLPENATNVTADVWCETNGDGDKRTYSMKLNGTGEYYFTYITPEDHGEVGIYHAQIYAVIDGVRTLQCEKKYLVRENYAGFTPEEPLPEGTYYMGDANMDQSVTAADALLVLQSVVKLTELADDPFVISDMDGNNEITAADALSILRTVVKLEEKRTITLTETTTSTEPETESETT